MIATLASLGIVVVVAARARPHLAASRHRTPRHRTPRARLVRRPGRHPRLAIAIGMLVAMMVAGPLLAAVVAAGLGAWLAGGRVRVRRRRERTIERALPDVIDLLVVGIRSGLTPRHALASIRGSVPDVYAEAIGEVEHRGERGQRFADALGALPERLGLRLAPLADSIAACERYGLPLEPLLVELTDQARSARRRADQADARTLPVRLAFPLVCCTLPSYVLVAIVPAVLATLASLGDHTP